MTVATLTGVRAVVPKAVGLTDASITNATGASQALLAANANRQSLLIANEGSTSWTINPLGGTAAAGAAGCITLHPGDSWTPSPPPSNAITGIGTAAAVLTILEG